jgi:mRNA interferase MazF
MKGDIVLVNFPFSDMTGNKVRPACVLADDGRDVTLAFISSVIGNSGIFDIKLKPNSMNNLKKESLLKVSKLATLSRKIILGKIGVIKQTEINDVDKLLVHYFQIRC